MDVVRGAWASWLSSTRTRRVGRGGGAATAAAAVEDVVTSRSASARVSHVIVTRGMATSQDGNTPEEEEDIERSGEGMSRRRQGKFFFGATLSFDKKTKDKKMLVS